MIHLRHEQPVLQRRQFFRGAQIWDSAYKDLAWFRPNGQEMTQQDWSGAQVRSLGFLIGGDAIPALDAEGKRVRGDTLLVLMNPLAEPVEFTLPALQWGVDWGIAVDTSKPEPVPGRTPAGGAVLLAGRSLMLLSCPTRIGR